MQPKLVIFDRNNTLVSTTSPIITTFRQGFTDCGLSVPEAGRIRPLTGYGLPAIVRHLIPDADGHVQAVVAETYASHYLNPNNHNMKLFDSAVPCLDTLKGQGYPLAVATGKDRIDLDRIIGQTDTIHFRAATTYTSKQPSKSAPEMVLALCNTLGPVPSETLTIGDVTYGLQMTTSTKAFAAAIATNAHAKAQLTAEPHLTVLDGLAELPTLPVAL